MIRRKTDGERIAERMVEGWALSGEHINATEKAIDRIVRRRMAEAWDDGWFHKTAGTKLDENPYRGRREK